MEWVLIDLPISLTGHPKTLVYVRTFAAIGVSNPPKGMNVCLLWMLCVVR